VVVPFDRLRANGWRGLKIRADYLKISEDWRSQT